MSDAKSGSDDVKVAALRAEIAQTREQLGETVEALAAKADVKARAQDKVEQVKQNARATVEQVKDSAGELAVELRTDPAVPARRAVDGLRRSVQTHPREWAVAAAALVGFALLVARRKGRL